MRVTPRHGWIALALLSWACAAGSRAGSGASGRSSGSSPSDPPLSVALAAGEGVFAPGEPIPARLVLTNRGTQAVTLQFTSGQRYDFTIQDASGRLLWRWSDGRAFTLALGGQTVPPGGSLAYEERLDPALQPGAYTVAGVITAQGPPLAASARIAIREPR